MLREKTYESLSTAPRDLFDLMRQVALFIPDEHPLADEVEQCMESMAFSPPENLPYLVRRFQEELSTEYSEADTIESPWWFRVIAILLSCDVDGSLTDSLNQDFRSVED